MVSFFERERRPPKNRLELDEICAVVINTGVCRFLKPEQNKKKILDKIEIIKKKNKKK